MSSLPQSGVCRALYSERSRNSYFYARTLIGREFSPPCLALLE